jgi:multisubunit Na+/H+ antiporter MnhF subunit
MSPFLYAVCVCCLATLLLAGALTILRLIIGPRAADRAVALDTITMVFVGIICILCMVWGSDIYFDTVWILTLVGFLGSAAIGRYLEQGRLFR